jgi:hypothetical protein
MKHTFGAVLLFSCSIAISQPIMKKDVVYGKATNWRNQPTELKMDIIYPSSGKKLPLIVFMHGGGFMEGSSKDPTYPFCNRLSKNGFVVASVEYRTGFEQSVQNYKSEITKAVYRAQQDEYAAIRFLVHSAEDYNIDTSLVFIAGESAGSVAGFFSAYVSQEDWDKAAQSIQRDLGSLYDSGNEYHNHFTIKGLISSCGGIYDTSVISLADMRKTPVLLFHSIDDEEIPFERATHRNTKQQLLLGSKDIAQRFKHSNGCYQLYYIKEAGHGYGFSADFISSAVRNFVDAVREGKCNSLESENKERNIAISSGDSDDVLFPNEDDKVIILTSENLQQFAGKYEGHGNFTTITVEDDHLKAQAPGSKTFDLFPLSETMFLEKSHNFRVEFVKDPQGKVKEQIFHATLNKSFNFKKVE